MRSIVERFWSVHPGCPDSAWPTFCFADPTPGLAITRAGRWYADGRPAPAVCLFGAVTRAARVSYSEDASVLGISFWPWVPGRVFGRAGRFSDRQVDVAEVWPSAASRLLELAHTNQTTEEAAAACGDYLASQQSAGTASAHADAAVLALLDPAARVETVARGLGITRQHLRRVVLAETGLTPKLLVRLSRFRQALEHSVREPERVNWPGIAAASGYADQSHLISEFRVFAGRSPSGLTALVNRC